MSLVSFGDAENHFYVENVETSFKRAHTFNLANVTFSKMSKKNCKQGRLVQFGHRLVVVAVKIIVCFTVLCNKF
jgi:hypothetical protein